MTGRKKCNKAGRDRVQVHATLTFQHTPAAPASTPLISSPELTLETSRDDDIKLGRPVDKEGASLGEIAGAAVAAATAAARAQGKVGKVQVSTTATVNTEKGASFAEHAIKILDHMIKDCSVAEVLKMGPREEMLGLTPLSMAAAIGHVDGTRKLLEAGACVEDKSSDGSTALLNAAHWRHLPVLDLLLQHGASVAACNNDGNNVLMVALRHGDVRAVNSLWPHRKNLDINKTNNDGCTALHLAAERKWESCVQFLIQNGANVNKQNDEGQTVLHIAAAKGDQPTAERLLASGATLLLEDRSGNNPFCLAVKNLHDGLSRFLLAKLSPEDRLYFCKRRVQRLLSPGPSDVYTAWNSISYLTADLSLRDSLYHSDVMSAAVSALNKRGLVSELAAHSCVVCCDLMYNPFPVADQRFVRQFLSAHGPEAVLDRLDSRGVLQDGAHSQHIIECKEGLHFQSHAQGQLQTRQQQVDFNTAFILLPIMAMVETPQGRQWFADAGNHQRIANHLRRLSSYRELMQLVGIVQTESRTKEVRMDRVAIVERFIAFFKTLENKDHEQKVRELLELEEREKSRKVKKREKKRQQRLKQKLKTRAGDSADGADLTLPASQWGGGSGGGSGGVCGSDLMKSKSQSLDALDDFHLVLGSPRVTEGVAALSSANSASGAAGQDAGSSEDEWVMVGGKRCYPSKYRSLHSSSALDHLPEGSRTGDGATDHGMVHCSQSASVHNEAASLDGGSGGGRTRKKSQSSDTSGCKASKSSMRWADIARQGNASPHHDDCAILPPLPLPLPPSAHIAEEERIRCKAAKPAKKTENYHEQFPLLSQQLSEEETVNPLLQNQATSEEVTKGVESDVLGAAHQFLEELVMGTGMLEKMTRPGTCACQAGSSNPKLDPSVLYEALTGWVWQAAVAQGLVTPDTEPPRLPQSLDLFTNQLLKLRFSTSSPVTAPPVSDKLLSNFGSTAQSSAGAPTPQTAPGAERWSKNDFAPFVKQQATSSSSTSLIKDWFDMTDLECDNIFETKQLEASVKRSSLHSNPESALKYPQACRANQLPFYSAGTDTEISQKQYLQDDSWFLKTTASTTSTSKSQDDVFLLGACDLANWLPAYSTTDESSKVLGCPVAEFSSQFGLPVGGSQTESYKITELAASRRSAEQAQSLLSSSHRLFLPISQASRTDSLKDVFQEDPFTEQERTKLGDAGSAFKSMQQKSKEEHSWPYCQSDETRSCKVVKTAVVHLAHSDSGISSALTQQRSLLEVEALTPTPDTSRSSCAVNQYDSFHQLSPATSTTSSLTGLHECLAPGFLRAAVGDVHVRAFGSLGNSKDCLDSVFQPVISNVGLLPTRTQASSSSSPAHLDNLYPDLSTVPEREHRTTRSLVSTLPKHMRAVGQGRPGKRSAHTNVDGSPCTDSENEYSLGWPSAGRPEERPSPPSQTFSLAAALSSMSLPHLKRPSRPPSPDVLFPEDLRSDDEEDPDAQEQQHPKDVFPSIHDMNERDLFQEVFSNSYFLEQIAIDQIRRRLRSLGIEHDDAVRGSSVLFHDLDYYASLYGVRLRDILGPATPDVTPTKLEKQSVPKRSHASCSAADQRVPGWKMLVKELGRKMSSRDLETAETSMGTDIDLSDSEDRHGPDWPWNCKVSPPKIVTGGDSEGEEGWWQDGAGSRRWRTFLRQILDMPWTMRRQYGKIVLPARTMEFNIGRTGRHPLILGFLTDGTEVGVLVLDRTRHELDTRLMATVAADSEPDVHFILRYKAVWECSGRVYLAMELCDYTLDEYVGIVRLDHHQDPLSANRLAWQLLKGLKYLHSNFAVPHGNLMPGWIFVDCDGRLRLAGYGLRDVTASVSSASRDASEKSSIEGDSRYWRATEFGPGTSVEPSFQADIQVAGMLLHYILTGGRHPYGDTGPEVEANLCRNCIRLQRVSQEADHLVCVMTLPDPAARPSIDSCLKHPFFWSGEKRFRLVLIVGSDILTEMKTGIPLTGAGSTSMVDILNIIHINNVSDNWLSEVDPVLVKEMRAFRQYKNSLPELVLFVYNCCLHFDKMSIVAKEVLDDPCKYFQSRFPALFMAVYRAMRASDRTDRTCYKPFF